MSWLRRPSAHFDQAVRAYSAELFQYAAWLARDRHRAEDILQDAFTRAWRHWDQVTDEAGRRSWLYTIVRNEFLRSVGSIDARLSSADEDPDADAFANFAAPTDFTLGIEARDLLARLPDKHLEPLLLQTLMGMSCEEIAAVLGVSPGAAMTRLTRARMALLELMHPDKADRPALRLVGNGGPR